MKLGFFSYIFTVRSFNAMLFKQICKKSNNNMKKIVYIETTIPSFYYEIRTEPDMIVRRAWTRQWWDNEMQNYQPVTSLAVIEELEKGDHPNKKKTLAMLSDVPLLSISMEIRDIIETYISRKLMPSNPVGDALHLAVASFHGCDFLLTWNCRHLANANKYDHIRRLNTLLGIFVPTLTTPFELISWEEGNEYKG